MTAHRSVQVPDQLALPLVPVLSGRTRYTLTRRIVPGWYADAACAGSTDPDAFYAETEPGPAGERASVRLLVDATDTCAFCPVARSCLATALIRDEHGVWGRTTKTQRDRLVADLGAGQDVDAVLDRAVLGPLADLTTIDTEWRHTA